MKNFKEFIRIIFVRNNIVLSIFSVLCLYLFVAYVQAYRNVKYDYIYKKQYNSRIDKKLRVSGLSIYLDDDEIYRFLRVYGGNLFVKSNHDSKYYSMNSFLLGEIPVTNRLFTYVMKGFDTGGDKSLKSLEKYMPIAAKDISTEDWLIFIDRLGEMTGHVFRLPTVDEWEYAARGGRESRGFKYAGSDSIDEVAVYKGNYDKGPLVCKQKKANELGFYDMSGLVSEITSTRLIDLDPSLAMYEDVPEMDKKFLYGLISRGGFAMSSAEDCEIVSNKKQVGANTGARLVLVK